MSVELKRQILRVLAPFVAGHNWGQKFIAERVLPLANTYGVDFTWEKLGNEGLLDRGHDAKRSLNAEANEVDPPANASQNDKLDEYALKTKIDSRLLHAASVQDQLRALAPADGLSAEERLQLGRARMLQHNIKIRIEAAVASLVFTAANYHADLKDATTDFGAVGIIGKVWTAKRKVRRMFGFTPDKMVITETDFLKLLENPDILERIVGGSNNTSPAEVTEQMIAGLFGLRELVIGTAVIQELAAPGEASATVTDIWTGAKAALIFSGEPIASESGEEVNEIDLASPAFGKLCYMDVPETAVRNLVVAWTPEPGDIQWIQVKEFAKPIQQMQAGYIFT